MRSRFFGRAVVAVSRALVTALAWCAFAACGGGRGDGPRPPSILFIMADEMRADAMGCAGHPTARTPHLDRLAGEGVRFTTAYTPSPLCAPGRWSILSGRYPHVHGVTDNGIPANPGEVLLPSILRLHGYRTAVCGKLHFTPKGPAYGFGQFWSYLDEGPLVQESYRQFLLDAHGDPSVDPIVPGTSPCPDQEIGATIGDFPYPTEDCRASWMTQRAVEYLRSQRESEDPWFLFVSYKIPHSPYNAPEPYHSMYDPEEIRLPETFHERSSSGEPIAMDPRMEDMTADCLRAVTAQYLGLVSQLDDCVGRLLDELDALGMSDDTIVVFTADHGNMLGEHSRFYKSTMHEGATRIPLLMRVPPASPHAAAFRGGRVSERLVEGVDLVPTLLDLAGLPQPRKGIQGRSVVGVEMGTESEWKDRCLSVLNTTMYRSGRYKLILDERAEDGTARYQLFDLLDDPQERDDLAHDPGHAGTRRDLVRQARALLAEQPGSLDIPGLEPPDWSLVDPHTRVRQRQLREAADSFLKGSGSGDGSSED